MQHNEDLDFLRGIGIVFVVLGHCFTTKFQEQYQIIKICWDVIYTFHMPIFFIVSGYIQGRRPYNINKLKDHTLRQTRKLFVPYILWSITLYGFYFVLQRLSIIRIPEVISLKPVNLVRDIMTFHVTTGNVLWFVYILCIISIVSYFIHSFMRRKYVNLSFLFIILILGFTANSTLTDDIFVVRRFLVMWIYYEIGVFIGKYQESINVKATMKQNLLLMIFYTLLFIGYIHSNGYIRYTLKLLCALIAVYILYSLSKYKDLWFYKAFNYLGKRTSYIYYMHNPYIVLIIATFLTTFSSVQVAVTITAAFTFGCMIPLFVGEILFSRIKVVKNVFLGG